jgi:hypothetical protein
MWQRLSKLGGADRRMSIEKGSKATNLSQVSQVLKISFVPSLTAWAGVNAL